MKSHFLLARLAERDEIESERANAVEDYQKEEREREGLILFMRMLKGREPDETG